MDFPNLENRADAGTDQTQNPSSAVSIPASNALIRILMTDLEGRNLPSRKYNGKGDEWEASQVA